MNCYSLSFIDFPKNKIVVNLSNNLIENSGLFSEYLSFASLETVDILHALKDVEDVNLLSIIYVLC